MLGLLKREEELEELEELEEERRRMTNRNFFYFARCVGAYVQLRYIAMLYTHSFGNQPYNMMVMFKMRDSVPSARYYSVCNVLCLCRISLILTYRVYRLYDIILLLQYT